MSGCVRVKVCLLGGSLRYYYYLNEEIDLDGTNNRFDISNVREVRSQELLKGDLQWYGKASTEGAVLTLLCKQCNR